MNEPHVSTTVPSTTRRQENAFYQRYYPRLKEYYSYHVRNSAIAEELTLVALGKVMTKLDDYDASKPMDNWVVRIARNHLIDYYRRRASQKNKLVVYESQAAVDDEGEEPAVETAVVGEEQQEFELLLADSLRILREWPGVQGVAIRLGLLENHDKPAISEKTGLTETQIKNLLTQARTRLRNNLELVEER